MLDFGLLLVFGGAGRLWSVVSLSRLVTHVFGQDLLAELVRLENRRVAVENVDLEEK